MIRLALVDDHDLFREGMVEIIHKMAEIELVFEASNGKSLLEKLTSQQVDVILMDLEMEEMDGIESTEQVLAMYPEIKIIVLTMHSQERMITYLMECGAHGYLLKNTGKKELETAIHEVYKEGYYFNHQTSKAMLSSLKRKSKAKPSFNIMSSLTSRELEVLQLICKDYSTQEIADALYLSPRTVEGHRQSLLLKFQVKNTIGLIIKAIQENVIVL